MMSTLTDRYIWGVLRAVPTDKRHDLEPEIRALVADAVDARVATGVAAGEAERSAILELGDPERLAARYTDSSLFLIGPRYFPEWKRLLSVLLPIVVPIVAIAVGGASYLGYMGSATGAGLAAAVASGLSTAVTAGIMVVFWVTAVFAVIERQQLGDVRDKLAWSPDKLPDVPAASARETLAGLAFHVTALVVGATALVWQQTAAPITVDGSAYPLFNPDLWASWLPYLLVVIGLQVLLHLVRYLRGWTWSVAIANAALSLAFVLPVLWLWSEGLLFDPGLVAALDRIGVVAALRPAGAVIAVVVVAATGWDIVDGLRKAARGEEARRAAPTSR